MSSDCLFCKIVAGEIPAKIVHEDEDVVAFRDIQPQAPTHVLVIPRRHASTLPELAAEEGGEQALGRLMTAVAKVAELESLSPGDGFRLVINTGERAAQSVFHVHAHVLGGRMFGWPPG
jgi:histidine triad (HIT) family protein